MTSRNEAEVAEYRLNNRMNFAERLWGERDLPTCAPGCQCMSCRRDYAEFSRARKMIAVDGWMVCTDESYYGMRCVEAGPFVESLVDGERAAHLIRR